MFPVTELTGTCLFSEIRFDVAALDRRVDRSMAGAGRYVSGHAVT